jgi:hypothetical protein
VADTDRSTQASSGGPPQMRDVVVGGDVRVGNVRAGEIMGGAVIHGSANTISIGLSQEDVATALEKYVSDFQKREADLRSKWEKEAQDLQLKPKEVLSSEQALARIAEKTELLTSFSGIWTKRAANPGNFFVSLSSSPESALLS